MTEWIMGSAALTLAVIGLRFALRGRVSPRLQYALWAVVLVRLLVPVNVGSSVLSLQNLTHLAAAEQGTAAPTLRPADLQGGEMEPPLHDEELQGAEDLSPAEPESAKTPGIPWKGVLAGVWAAGGGITGTVFLVGDLTLAHRLRRSRRRVKGVGGRVPVYVTRAIETPCLFGLLRPAVYVTPEVLEDREVLAHVLAHETAHLRHGDLIWAVLRAVCLVLHWYDPLVWWAAALSRRDGEMACDAAAVKALGEDRRGDYGRTLIGLTVQRQGNPLTTATTAGGGKGHLKERITALTRRPRTGAVTLILVVLLLGTAVGCTFTGAVPAPEREPAPPDSGAPVPGLSLVDRPSEEPAPTPADLGGPPPTAWTEEMTPAELRGIRRATVRWNGVHVIEDAEELAWLEGVLTASREMGYPTGCPFTSELGVELADGRVFSLLLADDSCPVWHCGDYYYKYAISNEAFFSHFSAGPIRGAEDWEEIVRLLPFIHWGRYAKEAGVEAAFDLMERVEDWACEDGITESQRIYRYMCGMNLTRGLDGIWTERYAAALGRLYRADPAQFAWCCLGSLGEGQQGTVMDLLAFDLGLSREETADLLKEALPDS